MSNKIFPIPTATPFIDKNVSSTDFSQTWQMYFKAIGDDLLTANIISNSRDNKNMKYVVNGNMCACSYYVESASTSDITISLPYTAALAFDIENVIYPPNTTSIIIPANKQYLRFWYIVSFKTN